MDLRRDWGRSRRRRPGWRGVGYTLLSVAVLGVLLGAVQLFVRHPPPVRYQLSLPSRLQVPGTLPVMPLPTRGEATVGVLGIGTLGSSGGDGPIPIASLTKVMTAWVVLGDHPLASGAQGPSLTLTVQDVANEKADAADGQSVVKVAAGEQLSELQAVQALLIGSANDIATALAAWDAGSVSAFVDRMNREAARLGMSATHYVDPTGVQAGSVSSADDQVALAVRAMHNPVFASTVAMPDVELPVTGHVFNYDFLVGHDGIIGIKTGSTVRAGGCFVFAAARSVAGTPVVIIGAVIGQRGPSILQAALNASRALIDAAAAAIRPVTVSVPGAAVGRISAPWARPVPLLAQGTWSTLGWPGLSVPVHLRLGPPRAGIEAGARLGEVQMSLAGASHQVAVTAGAALPTAPWGWRLRRL